MFSKSTFFYVFLYICTWYVPEAPLSQGPTAVEGQRGIRPAAGGAPVVDLADDPDPYSPDPDPSPLHHYNTLNRPVSTLLQLGSAANLRSNALQREEETKRIRKAIDDEELATSPRELLDRDRFKHAHAVLSVKVVRANNLVAVEKAGGSDPYAAVEYAQYSCRTRIAKETTNPVFEETFRFFVRDGEAPVRSLAVLSSCISVLTSLLWVCSFSASS